MLQRICVGVDGSDSARRAVTVGIAIAEATDATIDVVHVTADDGDAEAPEAEAVLDALAAVLEDASVPVERHAPDGDPAGTLVRFAEDSEADLLVLGRRGLGGVADRLLGSTVHSVLRQSDHPVLTVPDGDDGFELTDLLVPTDGSDAAERAAPIAASLAAQHDSHVHTCYAVDLTVEAGVFSAGGATDTDLERYEAEGQEHLDRLAEDLHEREPDLSLSATVVTDSPHVALTEYVDANDVDLVVIASKGDTRLDQIVGGVTDRLFEALDVPVLVVSDGSG